MSEKTTKKSCTYYVLKETDLLLDKMKHVELHEHGNKTFKGELIDKIVMEYYSFRYNND